MKKIALLVLVFMVSVSLFGQSPRLAGMGNVSGYISDDSSIFGYPGLVNNYKNTVYCYLGGSSEAESSYNFGLNYAVKDIVLGTYFNKPVSPQVYPMDIEMSEVMLDKSFQMFVGFMGNMGVKFTLAMDSYTIPTIGDNENTEGAMDFGIGYGYNTDKFLFGFDFHLPSFTKETWIESKKSIEEKEGKMLVNVNGKMKVMSNDKMDVFTKIGFNLGTSVYDDGIDSTDDKEGSMMGVSLGIGGNYRIDENNVLVMGITPFGMSTQSYTYKDSIYVEEDDELVDVEFENSTTTMILPGFNIGFESKVFNWLTLRSGIEQYYYMDSETEKIGNEENTVSYYDSMFSYGLGMSLMLKNFTLDCVVNEDILHNGINIITGETTSDVVGELMLKYNFK